MKTPWKSYLQLYKSLPKRILWKNSIFIYTTKATANHFILLWPYCDPGRTRTPTIGTGILRSIQLNYGTFLRGKDSFFCGSLKTVSLQPGKIIHFHPFKPLIGPEKNNIPPKKQ